MICWLQTTHEKSPIREYCFGYLRYWISFEILWWKDGQTREGMVVIRQRKWDYSKFKAFKKLILGGGFKYFLCSTLFGEDSQFDEHIFQMGWFNHQLMIVFGSFISPCWRDEHSWAMEDFVDWEARKSFKQERCLQNTGHYLYIIYLFFTTNTTWAMSSAALTNFRIFCFNIPSLKLT